MSPPSRLPEPSPSFFSRYKKGGCWRSRVFQKSTFSIIILPFLTGAVRQAESRFPFLVLFSTFSLIGCILQD